MTKVEQMDEIIQSIKNDVEMQNELSAIMEHATEDVTAEVDKWLAEQGYEFTLKELREHLEDGVPIGDDQLNAIAGGMEFIPLRPHKYHSPLLRDIFNTKVKDQD